MDIKYQLNIKKLEKAAFILKTVGHPTRLAIVDLLGNYPKLTVSEISNFLNCEQSLLSHHLINMKLKGVLNSEREGQNILYSLKLKEVSKLIECIENCECNF
jgi:DNA-binding transcriptional ArsR family regulator